MALALSAGLHVMLIFGFVLPAGSDARNRWTVVHARLQPREHAAVGSLPAHRPTVATPLGSPALKALPDVPPEPVAAPRPQPPAVPAADAAKATPATASAEASEPGALAIADPVHYPAEELDVYPRAITPIALEHPPADFAEPLGSVTLQVLIDDAGRVLDTTVVDATADATLEQAARQALARTRFHPASKAGRAVRSQILIQVEFDSAGQGAAR